MDVEEFCHDVLLLSDEAAEEVVEQGILMTLWRWMTRISLACVMRSEVQERRSRKEEKEAKQLTWHQTEESRLDSLLRRI